MFLTQLFFASLLYDKTLFQVFESRCSHLTPIYFPFSQRPIPFPTPYQPLDWLPGSLSFKRLAKPLTRGFQEIKPSSAQGTSGGFTFSAVLTIVSNRSQPHILP